jgi:hypothetical protein
MTIPLGASILVISLIFVEASRRRIIYATPIFVSQVTPAKFKTYCLLVLRTQLGGLAFKFAAEVLPLFCNVCNSRFDSPSLLRLQNIVLAGRISALPNN